MQFFFSSSSTVLQSVRSPQSEKQGPQAFVSLGSRLLQNPGSIEMKRNV